MVRLWELSTRQPWFQKNLGAVGIGNSPLDQKVGQQGRDPRFRGQLLDFGMAGGLEIPSVVHAWDSSNRG